MATPMYFYAMSAQMRIWVDRCCGPYIEMKNKEFYFLGSAAEDEPKIMDRIVSNFQGAWKTLSKVLSGVIFIVVVNGHTIYSTLNNMINICS